MRFVQAPLVTLCIFLADVWLTIIVGCRVNSCTAFFSFADTWNAFSKAKAGRVWVWNDGMKDKMKKRMTLLTAIFSHFLLCLFLPFFFLFHFAIFIFFPQVKCTAISVPKAESIVWSFAGRELNFTSNNTPFYVQEEYNAERVVSTVTLLDPISTYYGDYNCTITNSFGTDSVIIKLTAHSKFIYVYVSTMHSPFTACDRIFSS